MMPFSQEEWTETENKFRKQLDLRVALEAQDERAIQKCLDEGLNLNDVIARHYGCDLTLLMNAMRTENFKCFHGLLAMREKLDLEVCVGGERFRAIHYAAVEENPLWMHYIIGAGADLDSLCFISKFGTDVEVTALQLCVQSYYGNFDHAKMLISAGADTSGLMNRHELTQLRENGIMDLVEAWLDCLELVQSLLDPILDPGMSNHVCHFLYNKENLLCLREKFHTLESEEESESESS